MRFWFPDQGLKLLQWKCGDWTTGLPGKSQGQVLLTLRELRTLAEDRTSSCASHSRRKGFLLYGSHWCRGPASWARVLCRATGFCAWLFYQINYLIGLKSRDPLTLFVYEITYRTCKFPCRMCTGRGKVGWGEMGNQKILGTGSRCGLLSLFTKPADVNSEVRVKLQLCPELTDQHCPLSRKT